MKKLIVIIFILSFSNIAKSQIGVFIGSTFYNVQTTNPTKFGINAGFNIGPLYYTFSTNFVSNKGQNVDYYIDGVHKNKSLSSINIGYNIPIKSINNLSLTPYIGIIWSKDIYNSHGYIFNVYGDNFYDFGLTGKYNINDDMGVMLSLGYKELIKISYYYNIFKK